MASDIPKIVLITGCSTGIGLAIPISLANNQDGRYKVYATMRNLGKKEALEKAAGDSLDKTLLIRQLDVCSDEHVDKVVNEIIAKDGRLDILINNAGLGHFAPLEALAMEKIRNIIEINLFGVIRLTKKVLPIMKKQNSGHILTISSVAGIVGAPFSSIYCAAKFGTEGLYESLALECSKTNIKFSSIEPGPVRTKFGENAQEQRPAKEEMENVDEETKSFLETYTTQLPVRFENLWQTAEDIANVVLEAITSPNPHFRYLTNKEGLSAWVSNKYVDITGDAPLEAMRKRSLPDKK